MAELKRAETGVMVPSEDRTPLTFFEGIDFKLRAKGPSAGDNTVRQRIGELSADISGRGSFFTAHAKEYLRCFQPVKGVKFTNTTDVPTLFDQLKPTLEQFDKDEQREVLEYLVHDTTKAMVERQQPRSIKSGRLDITDATRQDASGFLEKLEDVIMERLEPTPIAGQTQFDRFIKTGEAAGLIYLGLRLGACTPIRPTVSPDITPTAITQTVPGIETPSSTDFQPTPTDIYHFGSGGPINQEKLQQMESQDPTVAKQIEWLNTWGEWYGSADPSIRPMTGDEARNDIVFYQWTGSDGSIHYKAAWKFDVGYPGYILVPPAINWEQLNPPVAAAAGHEIGPGQGPVMISTKSLEGSELAKMGVSVGAQLAVEQGIGDWVMVYQDKVIARVNEAGVWQTEAKHPEINPATSATTWPPEIQAQFKDVLTNPWTATAAEKTAFDTYLTTQWQLTLKDAGVANAEKLQGYDLLNAIIEHQAPIILTGTETPEQLAAYVVELPFSLHKLLRTDQNNLVGYHHEDGRYVEGKIDPRPNSSPPEAFRGPLQKNSNDWGYYYAYYGFGGTSSPKPDHTALLTDMGYLSSTSTTNPNNYGFNFYGEKIPAIGVMDSLEGDVAFFFRIAGKDPNDTVGVMLRMYDGSRAAYAEAYLPLSNVLTTASDTCLTLVAGTRLQTRSCQAGLSISDLNMEDPLLTGTGNGSLYYLLKLMSLYKTLHLSLHTAGALAYGTRTWKDGIPVASYILIPNVPKGFFTKP